MVEKFNINEFIGKHLSLFYVLYLNTETGVVVDKWDYLKVTTVEKKKYRRLPRWNLKDQEKIAQKYFNKIKTEDIVEKFEKIYKVEFTEGYMDSFHCLTEDLGLWGNYLSYQSESEAKQLVDWCIENKIEYYYDEKDLQKMLRNQEPEY